jgi:hypothetical protein
MAVVLLVGLLVALLIRSFVAGRERVLEPPPATAPPAAGPLPTPVAPATPTPADRSQ